MRRKQHEPTDDCVDHHCHHHHVDEPLPARYYVLCPECGHLYRTRWALVWAHWCALLGDWRHDWSRPRLRSGQFSVGVWPWFWALFRRPGKIYFCQLCIHDF